VVDRFGFSHEVPNLGIVGASVMGTSGAHNPTADGAGAGVAHRRASRRQLERDREGLRLATPALRVAIGDVFGRPAREFARLNFRGIAGKRP